MRSVRGRRARPPRRVGQNTVSVDKDVIDHLCATDPHWAGALQIIQCAMRQGNNDPAQASAQIVSALAIMAMDSPDPVAFLELCASSLMSSPFSEKKKS